MASKMNLFFGIRAVRDVSDVGTPKMIVPYEWTLENVEEGPMIIASKMISFRGQKVFRVGLKNHALKPVLFFMAIDLNKIGMKVEDVMYGIQGSGLGPAIMEQMFTEDILGKGSLQLFTVSLAEKVVGNCTFMFRIVIEGTDSRFSYQLSDCLAKDQLWTALKSQLHLADVEFIVKNKKISAHKAILAARSQVFAAEFEKKQPGKDSPHQIPIETGVEPSTVENFLHFVYTGEPKGTLVDEELLKLAKHYQLTTLTSLCQVALSKIETTQMTKFMASLHSGVDTLSSSRIMREKETEIFFDRTTPTFRCAWRFHGDVNGESKCVMKYQKENIFFAYFTRHLNHENRVSKFAVHFSCDKYRRFGLQVEDIYFNLKMNETCKNKAANGLQWLKLEETRFKKQTEILHFTVSELHTDIYDKRYDSNFDIKTICTIGNYYYEMMDEKWLTELWAAATNQKLTDVEIFVGTAEVMEVHRVILCARSPVLNESLNKISNTGNKSIVTFEAEFDVEIVKSFLNFLYTGSLKTTDGAKQLSKLATIYQVETLKNVCQPFQLFNANPMDGMNVEELTDYLLQL